MTKKYSLEDLSTPASAIPQDIKLPTPPMTMNVLPTSTPMSVGRPSGMSQVVNSQPPAQDQSNVHPEVAKVIEQMKQKMGGRNPTPDEMPGIIQQIMANVRLPEQGIEDVNKGGKGGPIYAPRTSFGGNLQNLAQNFMMGQQIAKQKQFIDAVHTIMGSPDDTQKKMQNLIALKATHGGNDYGLGVDQIVKQSADLAQKSKWEPSTMQEAVDFERAKKDGTEWKPSTKDEALDFETAKAGMREANKQPTQGQETTALYASRIKQANDVFDSLEQYTNNLGPKEFVEGGLPNFANFLKSGEMQSYQQAQKNFLNAVLRRESGAVISPSEFQNGREQYFPQPGDKPEVLAQKKANRDLVMKNFIKSSAKAYVPYEGTETDLPKISNRANATASKFQEGKIYKDANGNKAKYVDGKWVPIQ